MSNQQNQSQSKSKKTTTTESESKKRGRGRPPVAPENRAKKANPVAVYVDKEMRSIVKQIIQIEDVNPDPSDKEIDAWIRDKANIGVSTAIRAKCDYYAQEGVIITPDREPGDGSGDGGDDGSSIRIGEALII